MAVKRIAVLTGGGDCPGLNPTIKGVVTRAADYGIEVLGLQHGWKSLVGDEPIYKPLSVDDVRPIIKQGGTILHTSRTNAYNKNNPEYLPNLVKNFDRLGLDAIVAIGGDDTCFSAASLSRASNGRLRVVHVPKTIDNDLDLPQDVYTFGFQTARHIGVEIVKNLMVDAKTTSRWYFVVAMGRKAGHLALGIGKAAGATLTLVPEEFTRRAGPGGRRARSTY